MEKELDRKEVIWQFIDAAGGVPNRRILKDSIFLAQEYNNFLSSPFLFEPCSGLGTCRYNDEIDTSLDELLETGLVFDTGGPDTLKILEPPPPPSDEIKKAVEFTKKIHPDDLSMLAAFQMAIKRERQEQGNLDIDEVLRPAAATRVGWPLKMFEEIESILEVH